ncbi:elongation factor EF-2 [Monoraphidium neglectum]|uniref:Elongation factor EF-2 n=1 Tax=Monoraphidium neglectum TaxID=145388 RepID=A0A0D2IXY9_9CHLO|nr:elongation factor EF-2 [Monoraphidium neglectum]KIY92792.1 elongation factor EF-2 [Monoraphidium neglectum]|eukprot:XP_013891812.1 elongation factor EF-2 [Monoraphidium neglectum]
MISVPASLLPRRPGDPPPSAAADGPGEVFLAFGRVFSGVAREGARVHVLTSAYDPREPGRHRQTATLTGLYLMMGRALERLPEVPAGNILAASGLEAAVLKSATLSSTPCAWPLAPMAAPIVRVALEPSRPTDMAALAEGLRLLNRADPFVEVGITDKGEQLLGAAGEVHLETCVKDLRERFARVDFQVSPPLVAFRESIFCPEEAAEGQVGRPARVVEASTPSGACTVRVRAHALPGALASVLDDNAALLKQLLEQQAGRKAGRDAGGATAADGSNGEPAGAGTAGGGGGGGSAGAGPPGLAAFRQRVRHACDESADGKQLLRLLRRAWLLGPKHIGPNVLVPVEGEASVGGGSLFDAPSTSVVRTTRHGGALKPAQAAAAVGPSGGGGAADAYGAGDPAAASAGAAAGAVIHEATVHVPLGTCEAAAILGLSAEPGADAQQAQADAADGDAGAGTRPSSAAGSRPASRTGRPPSAPAAATATPPPAALGSAPGWQHVRGSIESGVVAGFSLATAAGPLMDEPLWGIAIEIEARLRPPAAAVLTVDAADEQGREQGGAADAPAPAPVPAAFDLQEDVYGPFSGQVMTAVAGACRLAVMEAEPRLVEALFLCQVGRGCSQLGLLFHC